MKPLLRSVLYLIILLPTLALAQIRTVVYALPNAHQNPVENYYVQLLTQALGYSSEQFQLQPAAEFISQSRALRELSQDSGVIDVSWSMTSIEREQFLTPIRIPLNRGLLGWRLLLTQTAQPLQLDAKNNRLLLVQGHDWPDTQILKANEFRVHAADDFYAMFTMVEKGRADAMPRAVIEIEQELATVAKQLHITPNIMLYYPTAQYFFVSPDDQQLAQAIEYGLRQMLADGSFEQLFQAQYGQTLQRLLASPRQVLILKNPLLPAATPLSDSLLWQALPEHFTQITP
ncbi:transporter substrate-binding domain-containing protein [Rheinheimera fenheensis]|uniref:transporter substrate-binding domain-containing protein n=1 Tax=Rheinheimera fenheensis TaxID=3152295 RepID=UPI00325F5301